VIAERLAVGTTTITYTQPADTLDCLYVPELSGPNQAVWFDDIQYGVLTDFSQVHEFSSGMDACLYETSATVHTLRASAPLTIIVVRVS
jgi:hypothetical protein